MWAVNSRHLLCSVIVAAAAGGQGCYPKLEEELAGARREAASARDEANRARGELAELRGATARFATEVRDAEYRLAELAAAQASAEVTVSIGEHAMEAGATPQGPGLPALVEQVQAKFDAAQRAIRALAETAQANQALQGMIARYQSLLAARESELKQLKARMALLEAEQEKSERTHKDDTARIEVLDQVRRGLQEEKDRLQTQVSAFNDDVKQAYVLVSPGRGLGELERRDELVKKWKLWVPGPGLLEARSSLASLRRVQVDSPGLVVPGNWRRPEVVSIHKYFPDLYSLREGPEALEINFKDPFSFWAISRFLIIQVQR